ncbi:MAG: DUF2239 family protein [Caulobacter sp.]|nr:DUF2239 family protein [Caulobacter sp.]
MSFDPEILCTAFEGVRRIAAGPLGDVAPQVRAALDARPNASILILADDDSRRIDVDLRGTVAEVAARMAPVEKGPGRPKLGVVPREVTLLPRHWEWLAAQQGGASVALRRLVEAARKDPREIARSARDGAYRFMSTLAGNLAGFEEATRALYAADRPAFETHIAAWPRDVREHVLTLAEPGFGEAS